MKLRYLHLSDLHFKAQRADGDRWAVEAFNQDHVGRSLVEAVRNITADEGAFDFLILTGDVAYSGTREEYEVALVFCEQVLAAAGLVKDRFFVVPGNHDVDRSRVKKLHRRTFYQFEDQDEITEVLSDPEIFPIIMHKFEEFNRFAGKAMGRTHFDKKTYHLVQALDVDKSGQNLRVNLLGLNSCLFSGYDGDDKGKLAFGLRQTDRALSQMDEDAPLTIAFFHHPKTCFHETDGVCWTRLQQKTDLVLSGHVHKPDNAIIQDASSRAVLISAGASYEHRTSDNSFNVVSIDLAYGKGEVQFYKYLHEHHLWKKNTDVNPHHDSGCFEFVIEGIKDNPLIETIIEAPQPEPVAISSDPKPDVVTPKKGVIFVHDYVLPGNFTGRTAERKRLGALLRGEADPVTGKQASLTTVRALGGMGKSCLARRVLEDFRGDGRFETILWFSFYEARTEDEGWFFNRLLEKLGAARVDDAEGASRVARARERLCDFLDTNTIMLILDGLEVIQNTKNPSHARYGNLNSKHEETRKLLAHICNQQQSAVLVTSRVMLSQFTGVSGYLELDLSRFTPAEGADYLASMQVKGERDDLLSCSELMGGHPLALKATGIQLCRKHLPASQVTELVGDPIRFRESAEAKKVSRIVDTYREALNADQEYFLKMLSIHPHPVTPSNFPVLIQDYQAKNWHKDHIMSRVVHPLVELELIEDLGDNAWSAHPLMKLAYTSWLDTQTRIQAHRQWAQAAEASPDLFWAGSAKSLEELQPWLDATTHYLDASDFDAAWSIYDVRGVDSRLYYLGLNQWLGDLGRRFELAVNNHQWKPGPEKLSNLWSYLGLVEHTGFNRKASLRYAEKQLVEAEKAGEIQRILDAAGNISAYLMIAGQVKQAEQMLKRFKDKAQETKQGWGWENFCRNEDRLALYSGAYDQIKKQASSFSDSTVYNQNNYRAVKAEALMRANRLDEAREELAKFEKVIAENHFLTLLPHKYSHYQKLALKNQNLREARRYNDMRIAVNKEQGRPKRDDGFLLVAEAQYDMALRQEAESISSPGDEKFNKKTEIEALLITAQAWHGKQNPEKARDALTRAETLMEQTGCYRYRDDWEDTRILLGLSKTPE